MKARLCIFLLNVVLFGVLEGCHVAPSGGDGSIKVISNNGSDLLVCDYKAVKDTLTLPLSELIEDCKLIRFDNADTALFKLWMTTVSDNYIGVRQRSSEVFKLFDHDGKFLCDVGAKGQGPGEYAVSGYDEIIDEKQGKVYLSFFYGNKINVYDLTGKYLQTIEIPFEMQKPKISVAEDGCISVFHMPFKGNPAVALQVSSEGKIQKLLAPEEFMYVDNFDGEVFSYQNVPDFDMMPAGVDTLYHYNFQDNILLPVFTMEFPNASEKPWHIYQELPDRFLTYVFGGPGVGGTVSSLKNEKTSSFVKIVNDFYGGIPVNGPVCFNKGWYVYNLEPMNLQEVIEKRLSSKDCSDADREKLNEVLSSIDENDNNYLFFGKLKQQ